MRKGVQRIFECFCTESARVEFMLFPKAVVFYNSVVGGEEHKVVAFSHLLIESRQQLCYLGVELNISIFYLERIGTVCMSHKIGRRKADSQEVGVFSFTELFAF